MTIKDCIDRVDNVKPNQYTVKEKVDWLSFIDEKIINDILKTHEGYDGRYDTFTGYSEDRLSVMLIVPSPYDRLYTEYLKMKIDGENGETARYNNSAALFNSYLMEYRKHYNKTHMPLDTTGQNRPIQQKKPSVELSGTELENIARELHQLLLEELDQKTSPDKIYSIVMNFVNNNIEMLRGLDGYTPKVLIGKITPLENDADPYVENVGTGKDVVLNFGLPKAGIKWIDIESKWVSTAGWYPVELDSLIENGLYGLKCAHGNEYLIVTTQHGYITQTYIDSINGIRARKGKQLSDKSVEWNDWQEYVMQSQLENKASITWLEIGSELTESGYPIELDTVVEEGFYGLKRGFYDDPYVFKSGEYDYVCIEYLIVSRVNQHITQMYIDATNGIRVRTSKGQNLATVVWDEWNKQFDYDYVDRTTDQEIDGHKAFFGGISVSRLSGANVDLDINGAGSLNLSCDNGDVVIAAKDGDGEVKVIGALNAYAVEALGIRAKNQVIAEGGVITNRISVEGGDLTFATPDGELMFSELLKTLRELTEKVAALESVNQDLESIIELQESYIGGEE